jgi:hypothetical protein
VEKGEISFLEIRRLEVRLLSAVSLMTTTHLLGEEVLQTIPRGVFRQSKDFELLSYRFDDDLLEGVFCVSAELA